MIGPVDIQRLLRAAGYYSGDLDGDIGPKTRDAIARFLKVHENELPQGWASFGMPRQAILAIQIILRDAGFEIGKIDGFAGMLTKQGLTDWNMLQAAGKKPEAWRPDDTPEEEEVPPKAQIAWGRQKDMERRFGPAGGAQCTRGQVKVPYEMLLAWDTSDRVETISCHEMVALSVERTLLRVASVYSPQEIKVMGLHLFGGCFNFRKKRGGATLSTHAWGIALDFDPERNQLKWGRDRARLAKDDAIPWWRCWEAEGWTSLGRARNFDWMHVQAPGL